MASAPRLDSVRPSTQPLPPAPVWLSLRPRPVSTDGAPARPRWRDGFSGREARSPGDARRHASRPEPWIALAGQAGSAVDEDFPGLAALVSPGGSVTARLPTGVKEPSRWTFPTEPATATRSAGACGSQTSPTANPPISAGVRAAPAYGLSRNFVVAHRAVSESSPARLPPELGRLPTDLTARLTARRLSSSGSCSAPAIGSHTPRRFGVWAAHHRPGENSDRADDAPIGSVCTPDASAPHGVRCTRRATDVGRRILRRRSEAIVDDVL
jgi:hypothetical protein